MERSMNMKTKLMAGILAVCLALPVICLSAMINCSAAETPPLPEANTEIRHAQDCTVLSPAAEAYYTGAYSYAALSALPGAADASTSLLAMQENPLFDALHSLMTDSQTFFPTYSGYKAGALAYYWSRTDTAPECTDYISFYSDIPYYYDSTTKEKAFNMEREHIWPKSRASFSQQYGGADLHHLRPSVSEINQAKSDHAFGNAVGVYPTATEDVLFNASHYGWVSPSNDIFECKDDVKGDVARILLYIYCRWTQPNLYSDIDTQALPALDEDDKTNTGLRVMADLNTLLEWIEDDPVDTWEMRRNDLIEQVQGNRNVFIDYPELAWQLFGMEAPAALQTPTHMGCHHQYALTQEIQPDCIHEGVLTQTCSICGTQRTRRSDAGIHMDNDGDHVCDGCGISLTFSTVMTRSDTLQDGDHVLLFNKAKSVVPARTSAGKKIPTIAAAPENEQIRPPVDAEIFRVVQADGGFYLLNHEQKYLSGVEAGNVLYYTDMPDAYSLWTLGAPDAEGYVTLICVNTLFQKEYMDTAQPAMLEIYGERLTTYYTNNPNEIYRFALYTCQTHCSLTPLPEPICSGDQTVDLTCALCGASYEVIIPAAEHKPGAAFRENEGEGGYDEVISCEICGQELERTHFTHTTMQATTTETALSVTSTIYTQTTVTETTAESASAVTGTTGSSAEEKTIDNDTLCRWACADYKIRTGITPAQAAASPAPDGQQQIQLFGQDGQILDVYTVDPVSGIGSSLNNGEVNLPQTGNHSPRTAVILLGAILLTGMGICAVAGSGLWRKSADENE